MSEVTPASPPEVAAFKTLDDLHRGLTAAFAEPLKKNADEIEILVRKVAEQEALIRQLSDERRTRNFVGLPGKTGDPAKDYNLARNILGHTLGWQNKDGIDASKFPEREISEAATQIHRKTAQAAGVDGLGGFAIPQEQANEWIEELKPESVALSLGVRTIECSGSPFVMPKITSRPTIAPVDENVALATTSVTIGQVGMTPKEWGAIVEVSKRMLIMNSTGFAQEIQRLMIEETALLTDQYIMKGTGANGQPRGMLNWPGINTVTVNTPAVDYLGADQNITDKLEDLIGSLEDDNALKGSLAFAFHSQAKRKMKKSKDADGNLLFTKPSPTTVLLNGAAQVITPGTFFDYPYKVSNVLAGSTAADMIFANWADVVLGRWGSFVIDSAEQAGNAWEKRQILYRVTMLGDVMVRHAESVATFSDTWNVS